MYVKATPRSGKSSTFIVKDDEITTGTLTYWDSLASEEILADLDLEPATTVLRFLADEEQPTFAPEREDGSEGKGWNLSYAYWWDWDKAFLRLVVTDGTMYVLGDNGKTIDRV